LLLVGAFPFPLFLPQAKRIVPFFASLTPKFNRIDPTVFWKDRA
jgi:hypothetical protein